MSKRLLISFEPIFSIKIAFFVLKSFLFKRLFSKEALILSNLPFCVEMTYYVPKRTFCRNDNIIPNVPCRSLIFEETKRKILRYLK